MLMDFLGSQLIVSIVEELSFMEAWLIISYGGFWDPCMRRMKASLYSLGNSFYLVLRHFHAVSREKIG